jgi:hypothetical protein
LVRANGSPQHVGHPQQVGAGGLVE